MQLYENILNLHLIILNTFTMKYIITIFHTNSTLLMANRKKCCIEQLRNFVALLIFLFFPGVMTVARFARKYGAVIFFPTFAITTILADWTHTRAWKEQERQLARNKELISD